MANLRKFSTKYMNQSVCAIFCVYSNAINHVCNTNVDWRPPMRTFSRTSHLAQSRNFYNDLGLPRTATQSEIKSAYYNLSMIFHPDKNEGSEAAQRFRRISEAYEVLGNFRTRRMYDKGIGSYGKGRSTHSPGTESEIVEVEVEDDAQTKFYKQHMVKSQPPIMADRMTARDFDQVLATRISECFKQGQSAKARRQNQDEDDKASQTKERQIVSVYAISFFIFAICIYLQTKQNNEFEVKLKEFRDKKS